MSVTINASTSSGLVQSADTSGTVEIQSNGTTKFTVASTGAYGQLVSGTVNGGAANPLASGTTVDFTSIPSWVKRITVMFNGVSTNGTSSLLLQMGTSSGIQNTGYSGMSGLMNTSGANAYPNITAGIPLGYITMSAASAYSGSFTITNLSSNIWTVSGNLATTSLLYMLGFAGAKDLAATLDRIRITTVNGTDTFDAGTINILYEG
jgi:hypothetical protein